MFKLHLNTIPVPPEFRYEIEGEARARCPFAIDPHWTEDHRLAGWIPLNYPAGVARSYQPNAKPGEELESEIDASGLSLRQLNQWLHEKLGELRASATESAEAS